MNKVEIILNDYINHNDLEGAISLIFNSEDEINNEINKFKKDNKNYIFEHIDFFYEYKKTFSILYIRCYYIFCY